MSFRPRDKVALAASKRGSEIWRSVPGYEGHYEVSNLGRLRSIARVVPHALYGQRKIPDKVRAPTVSKTACSINLSLNGQNKMWLMHHLVLLAFCGPRPKELDTRHLDGDFTNNALYNIVYGTRKENVTDALRHGTATVGKNNGRARLTEDDVRRIRRLIGKYTMTRIAKHYGVGLTTIHHIKSGTTWARLS